MFFLLSLVIPILILGLSVDSNADEKIWLVIWEAKLIIQIPAGVVFLYPSALFLHFNFNIDRQSLSCLPLCMTHSFDAGLQVVRTSDGSFPTPENSVPLHQGNTLDGGRGSMVWFTQATMLMTAELPVATMKEAEELEKKLQQERPRAEPYINTSYNVQEALQRGIYPYIHSCG